MPFTYADTEYVYTKSRSCEQGVIRSISIENNNVFDENDDKEDGFFYRMANNLHIKTQKNIIRSQILMRDGDCFSSFKLEESERILRRNRYLRDVRILTNKSDDGQFVDLNIETSDTWSTKVKFGYGQSGGASNTQLGIQENNLLGLGLDLGLSIKNDTDRRSTELTFSDQQLFGSRYRLDLSYANNSDGSIQYINIEKPFYALDSPEALGFSFRHEEKEEGLYYQAKEYFSYLADEQKFDAYYGWSDGLTEGAVVRHRLGIIARNNRYFSSEIQPNITDSTIQNYVESTYLLPEDEIENYPYYAVDYSENSYQKIRNHQKIGRIEDRYIGLAMGLSVGYVSPSFGSANSFDDSYWKLTNYIANEFELSDMTSLEASLNMDVELRKSKLVDALEKHSLKLYKKQSPHFTFYADYVGVNSHDLEGGKQLFLDANSGLRGYPLRYLSGTRTQKITLEQRYFSDYEVLRLFNIGAAVFFDAGMVSGGTDFEEEQNGLYRNIGFGLRIANNRSSEGVILHIDFAKPLDSLDDNGFQLTVDVRSTF